MSHRNHAFEVAILFKSSLDMNKTDKRNYLNRSRNLNFASFSQCASHMGSFNVFRDHDGSVMCQSANGDVMVTV